MKRLLLLINILVVVSAGVFSQGSGLRESISQIIKDKRATVGVALVIH